MSKSQVKRKLAQGAYNRWIDEIDTLLKADHSLAPFMARGVIEWLVYSGWTPPADTTSEDA